ncbi:MAG TPA: hypothetical protein VK086_08495 [Ruania sp.]|nr:hypothetical protein [Ruania sp.]
MKRQKCALTCTFAGKINVTSLLCGEAIHGSNLTVRNIGFPTVEMSVGVLGNTPRLCGIIAPPMRREWYGRLSDQQFRSSKDQHVRAELQGARSA